MASRFFDDQDDFGPAAHSAAAGRGYLFGDEPWTGPIRPQAGRVYRYDDDPEPQRGPGRRRASPGQHAQGHRTPRRSVPESLPESDEPVGRSSPRPRPTQARTGQTRSGRRAAAQRARMRRRRSLALLLILIGTMAVVVDLARGPRGVILTADPVASPSAQALVPTPVASSSTVAEPARAVVTQPSKAPPVAVPERGAGTFAYATGTGKIAGTAGTLNRYQVMVEKGTGQDADAFASAAEATLGDERSWIAGGKVRFQRVPQGAAHDFVIYLATAVTSEKMCAAGGLQTERYTSCRLPGKVIINLSRWLTAVPGYGAPLSVYQQYVINHEVGHQLEFGHEACPGKGMPAPVMQQQTLALKGCVANAWPYVDGARLAGKSIA